MPRLETSRYLCRTPPGGVSHIIKVSALPEPNYLLFSHCWIDQPDFFLCSPRFQAENFAELLRQYVREGSRTKPCPPSFTAFFLPPATPRPQPSAVGFDLPSEQFKRPSVLFWAVLTSSSRIYCGELSLVLFSRENSFWRLFYLRSFPKTLVSFVLFCPVKWNFFSPVSVIPS